MDFESSETVKESGYSSATSSGHPVVSICGRFSDSYSPNTASSIACLSLISPDRLRIQEEFEPLAQAAASTSKLHQSFQNSPFQNNHSYSKSSIIVALDLGGALVFNKIRRRFPSDPVKRPARNPQNNRESVAGNILIETCDRGRFDSCSETAPVSLPDVPINSPGRPMTAVNPFPVARPRRSRPREADALHNERLLEVRRTLGRRLRLIADEFDAPYNLRRRRLLNDFVQNGAAYRFLHTIAVSCRHVHGVLGECYIF